MKKLTYLISAAVLSITLGCHGATPTLTSQIDTERAKAEELGWYPISNVPLMEAQQATDPKLIQTIEDVKKAIADLSASAVDNQIIDVKPELEPYFAKIGPAMMDIDQGKPASKELIDALASLQPVLDPVVDLLNRPVLDHELIVTELLFHAGSDVFLEVTKALNARVIMSDPKEPDKVVREIRALRNFGRLLAASPNSAEKVYGIVTLAFAENAASKIAKTHFMDKALLRKLADIWAAGAITADYQLYWLRSLGDEMSSLSDLANGKGSKTMGTVNKEKINPARLTVLKAGNESLKAWNKPSNDLDFAMKTIREPSRLTFHAMCEVMPKLITISLGHTDGTAYKTLEHIKEGIAADRLTYLLLKTLEKGPSNGVYSLAAEASDKAWIDPYSDKAMLFKRTEKGFVIYSVGKNGKDDGGPVQRLQPDPNHSDDYGIEYP